MVFLNDYAHSETSEFGENGILRKLFDKIGTENAVCVDVGAQYVRPRSTSFP